MKTNLKKVKFKNDDFKMKFEELYNNYRTHMATLQIMASRVVFKNRWSLWYHNPYDSDWSLASYKKIYDIDNIRDFWMVYNNHYDILGDIFINITI